MQVNAYRAPVQGAGLEAKREARERKIKRPEWERPRGVSDVHALESTRTMIGAGVAEKDTPQVYQRSRSKGQRGFKDGKYLLEQPSGSGRVSAVFEKAQAYLWAVPVQPWLDQMGKGGGNRFRMIVVQTLVDGQGGDEVSHHGSLSKSKRMRARAKEGIRGEAVPPKVVRKSW